MNLLSHGPLHTHLLILSTVRGHWDDVPIDDSDCGTDSVIRFFLSSRIPFLVYNILVLTFEPLIIKKMTSYRLRTN